MYLLSRGSGYPVLFIHGLPTNSSLWSATIERLRDRFTCFAVDLPGLGRTPAASYSANYLESLAEQIDQIRVERKIEKWHVVGHDAGSAVAVHYAYRFQKHVDRLVLLSPAMFPELKPFRLFRVMRAPIAGEVLAPLISAIFWKIVMRMALSNPREQCDSCVEDFRAPFAGLRGGWRLMSVLRFGDPAEVLASIPKMLPQLLVPTLILQGARDKAIPERFAQRAGALIPHSAVAYIDCGHFIPLNRPEIVAAELRSFFEGAAVGDRKPTHLSVSSHLRPAARSGSDQTARVPN